MSNGFDLLTFDAGDLATAVAAVALHVILFALVAAAAVGVRPDLMGRDRRRALLRAAQPAVLIGGLALQLWVAARLPAFHPRNPLSSHNLLVFLTLPVFFHLLALAADRLRPAAPAAAGQEADYSDVQPGRPVLGTGRIDVTPPRARRPG